MTHSISWFGQLSPRPVLEVRIVLPGGEEIVLFICHWKSKLGGEFETEDLRRAHARIVARRLSELEHESPDIPALVIGDMNENHDEFFRSKGAYITALLPDSEDAAALIAAAALLEYTDNDFLLLSGQQPPRSEYVRDAVALYSPWMDGELAVGSFYYQDAWETIDHALFNRAFFDKQGWEYRSFEVLNVQPFAKSSGQPWTYRAYTGSGLSDHLPLLIHIEDLEE
jgi:endonuclease/exonuclease/phosphatase family metal-dependent hydrolase